ncbi:MAG: endonuclease MutS2 [Saprospiraceae bacterium]|nr:endonuclease MutS2 [Saprospiraceae bacterium]
MQLEPSDLYEKLEFDKVLELLEQECVGDLGKERVREIKPDTSLENITDRLKEVKAFSLILAKGDPFPIQAYHDIREELRMLELEGYVLPVEGLQKINLTLCTLRDILKFFNGDRQEVYPELYSIVQSITFDGELILAIEKIIDEEGNIKPDASEELLRIHTRSQSKKRELEKQFRFLINQYRKNGWLTDNVESFRNGRRVLSVPSEHKRRIRGIIHDESTTGKTAFIEPEGVIEINNDIFDLETQYKREIYRLLKELSATLRPYIPFFHVYQGLLIRFDLIQAKGRLGIKMKADMPKIQGQPNLGLMIGYHPLLLLKNQALGKKTVPFNLYLRGKNRLLVLSGPNAGGKSITMKSVGLLQLMLQSGMLIPVDPESEMGVFNKIFADIGDQQSIEDDLSTYSSRLANARSFLEGADEKTLILIDEFGSGTDPKIGGAIAEAVLRELNFKEVHGVITTHYSNLKIFAFKTRGIVNGCMLFDNDNLSPTYELKVGRPGSSYAFEIAQKSGLPNKVLKYARHKIGKNEKAVDELLVDLQREKKELEDQLDTLTNKQSSLERLIRSYEAMSKDLDFRKKKLKLESKEQELQQVAHNNKEIQRVIREIREKQNLEQAKQLAAQAKEERKELAEEVHDLREKIYYQPEVKPTNVEERPIKVGDFVKLRTGGATGKVESLDKKKAVVWVGDLKMTIKLRDLQLAKEPLEIRSTKSVHTGQISNTSGFQSKIDIRGMRMEEAMKMVEDFVDRALIANSSNLRIVHGKGNGVLRKVVRQKLREYYNVEMNIRHPEAELGGDGVTLIEIK